MIVFSKCDLCSPHEYVNVYSKTKFKTLCCSAADNKGIDEILEIISGKVCAFTGNSGVGKSSILNAISPELSLATNSTSAKLGRGRHTTRTVTLYKINDGFVADTPGFSSIDFENSAERIYKDELTECFPEFSDFVDACRFSNNCSHTTDKGCAVVKAVSDGLISADRHSSYLRMYEEVKNIKKWEQF